MLAPKRKHSIGLPNAVPRVGKPAPSQGQNRSSKLTKKPDYTSRTATIQRNTLPQRRGNWVCFANFALRRIADNLCAAESLATIRADANWVCFVRLLLGGRPARSTACI